jgi:hypothetical protein
MFDDSQGHDAANPFSSPLTDPRLDASESGEDDGVAELRAFIGRRADYYLKKWGPMIRGNGIATGMNWAALFFSGFWLPYRKMFRATAILYGFVFVESIVEEVLSVGFLGYQDVPRQVDLIVNLAVAFVCGTYGNRWYFSHAKQIISQVRAERSANEDLLEHLSKRGGTSFLAAVGLFLCFIAAMALLGVVAAILEGTQF